MIKVEYGEKLFDDISDFGDNTDRVNDIMAVPTVGQTSVVRYKVPTAKLAKIQCMAVTCDYGARLLQGAYTTAQDGALIQVRFDSTIKLEQKFNWTGIQGYIGGADDYNAENEIMLTGYNLAIDANTAIDILFTGRTNVRRMVYIELYGTLDNGTEIREGVKIAIDGTTATSIPVYTVPSDRTLILKQFIITTRHIDLYAGRGYFMYNGLPVMTFDISQTEVGGVYGVVFPFYDLPARESASIGIRMDSFECGNEIITASVYSNEEDVGGTIGATCFAY